MRATRSKRSGADLVLVNGHAYTVDGKATVTQAVAVRGRRIVFVGSTNEAQAFVRRDTQVLDLQGRTVLPGFVDSHAHVSCGVKMVFEVQLWEATTLDGYLQAVHSFASGHPDAPAIVGSGWDPAVLGERGPVKHDLDRIDARRPIALNDRQGHALWANSKALELAGITGATPDPADGGIIERMPGTVGRLGTPYGEPSGTLRWPASELLTAALPAYTASQVEAGIQWFQENVARPLGITAVCDPGIPVASAETQAYETLARRGELTMWTQAAYELQPSHELASWLSAAAIEREAHVQPTFRTPAVKVFADGVLPGRTAYLKADYSNEPGFRGEPFWTPEEMRTAFAAVDAEGFQIQVHAVGDAASAQTLDALEYTRAVNGRRDRRPLITHLRCVDPSDIPRLAKLGVTASLQPYWALKRPLYFRTELPCLGAERAAWMYPMRSYFDAGARVVSSSDWYVTMPPDPLIGIQTGVMRWYPGSAAVDEPLNPDQGCTVPQMIRSFTINGARALFLDKITGSIVPGKSADMVVLDTDILKCPHEEIGRAKVLMTIFRGEVVYRDTAFDSTDCR